MRRRNISSGSGLRQAKCECAYVAPRCTRSQPLPAICASLLRTTLQLCVARWRRQCPHHRPSRRAGTRRPPHASNAFLRPTLSPPMHTTTIIYYKPANACIPTWMKSTLVPPQQVETASPFIPTNCNSMRTFSSARPKQGYGTPPATAPPNVEHLGPEVRVGAREPSPS